MPICLRDQRARCLCAGRRPAAEGETRRRSGGAVRRTRRAPRRPSAKPWPRAPTAPSTSKKRLGAFDPLAAARLLAAALQAEKPDLVLTGLQSDDLGYGQTGVILAELLGLPHATIIMQVEKQDGAHPREARTGRRLVPARGDAAAGAADHPIRHQQAALRHPDGHQEGEDQRSEAADARPNWALQRGQRRALRWSASTCPSAPSRRRSSTAPPRRRRPSWWRS